jgi:DNA-binding NtrC family response regulator
MPQGAGSKLDDVERAVLTQALEASGGNKSAAARLIGVDRKVLDRKWERLSDRAPADAHEKLVPED